jgi:hypothetical protein
MVSDGMVKIVFLSVPVSGRLFPLRKGNPAALFTVKHIFLKIKLWLAELANREAKGA